MSAIGFSIGSLAMLEFHPCLVLAGDGEFIWLYIRPTLH